MLEGIRTDLAVELQECCKSDEREIEGVELVKEEKESIRITEINIFSDEGSRVMNKPKGTYITIEAAEFESFDELQRKTLAQEVSRNLEKLSNKYSFRKVLAVGLGNREITPDSLGPMVIDKLFVTRHLIKEYGWGHIAEVLDCSQTHGTELAAVVPGVMAQTGMETAEYVKGIVTQIKPDLILAIDALAARSIERVNTTIQLTDTGICPGAGIGNNRDAINKESVGCPVIAIGVPTVVDAATIVRDAIERMMPTEKGANGLVQRLFSKEKQQKMFREMFVTPKTIDEAVKDLSITIAEGINRFLFKL